MILVQDAQDVQATCMHTILKVTVTSRDLREPCICMILYALVGCFGSGVQLESLESAIQIIPTVV